MTDHVKAPQATIKKVTLLVVDEHGTVWSIDAVAQPGDWAIQFGPVNPPVLEIPGQDRMIADVARTMLSRMFPPAIQAPANVRALKT